MSKKFRSKLDERTVSYAIDLIKSRQEDESFGSAVQLVAKAAMNVALACDTLLDSLKMAGSAPSDDKLTGADHKRIEAVFSGLSSHFEEVLSSELVQPLELLAVMGIHLAPDPEDGEGLKDIALGLGLAVEDLTVEDESEEEARRIDANTPKPRR